MKQKSVLHLARWYPNRYDSMYGLFVKRHVEATALYGQATLIYTHAVEKLADKYEVSITENSNQLEVIVYYRDFCRHIPGITSLIKGLRFVVAVRKGFKELRINGLKPDFIHIHILSRLGIFGLYYKLFHRINYGITEHWSRYLPNTGNYGGFMRKMLTKRVVANANFVTTVTENLHQAMLSHGLKNKNYFVLPNVVAPEFYNVEVSQQKTKPTTFIHLSSFEDKSKNISGIIRVIEKLSQQRDDFIFKIIGDGMDFQKLKSYAEEIISHQEVVEFTGLLEGEALVEEIVQADAMVIFSNYENFPVVINEALVLGIPVIATQVGGISEMVNDKCGVLIPKGDEEALQKMLSQFLNKELDFDENLIQNKYSEKFSPKYLGKLLWDKYDLKL